ncbi:MAG TPA: Wadjet anti-phage system protein JetD domain-containing protein [Telluria sp.]|nr:Wadjet anti-phage system protein JetD domain-containing protein [Telluria sp.]
MSWTTSADLRQQVRRLWERGELLSALAGADTVFPRRLVLKCPSSAEITGRFEEVRQWAAGLRALPHCRMEMRDFAHRVFGNNCLPQAAWLDSLDDALAMIGKQRDAAHFRQMLDYTGQHGAALLPWLARKPLRALELADSWHALLAVVSWLAAHPRPGIYLRQVDIPGIDSKFIEANRGVLAELLDLSLAPEAIDTSHSGVAQFARRYGFRDKPLRLRFRMLDPALAILPGHGAADISLDAASFARLAPPAQRVFVTENEINYLAFPPVRHSMVVFGAGYGWEVLAQAAWLGQVSLLYWGDIDTHGFAILNQLRARFGHVESVLMDHATLMAHQHAWGEENAPIKHDLPFLTPGEQAVYDTLRDNALRANLRLEQEKIGFNWLSARLRTSYEQ